MKHGMTLLTKLTAGGLVAASIAIWIQWLSGDPAYPKFPPGPVFFCAVAALVVWGRRWNWTPAIGTLISLLVTVGWFVRLPKDMLLLRHPGALGGFAPGIFVGSLLLIISLLVTDVAGISATIQSLRRSGTLAADGPKLTCRILGVIFVLVGILMIVGKTHIDPYHNLMHMIWGALAIGISFFGATAARRCCAASGVFYLALAILGLSLGNPAANHAWHFGPMLLHTADHIFHMVLGLVLLAIGLLSELSAPALERPEEA